MSTQLRRLQHGMSLIEALVALALMAFGMLGIVGVQSTLRLYSDISKQRSEAVRIAQQSIENARSFTDVTSIPAPTFDYTDVTSIAAPGQSFTGYTNKNTDYLLTMDVVASDLDTGSSTAPRMKTLRTTVSWLDRTNNTQSVELNTTIARIMPELTGTLALPAAIDTSGLPTRVLMPAGRNVNIPVQAVNFGDGTSGYIPPGQTGTTLTAFLFDNSTALISLCTTAVASNASLSSSSQLTCSSASAWPLSGIVDFAAAGTATEAASPSGAPQSVQAGLTQTFPTSGVGAPACFTAQPTTGVSYVAYICAVPVATSSSPASAWSGFSYVTGAGITGAAGGSIVCRYTAGPPAVASRGDLVVPAISNAQHPRAYSYVAKPLSNQNFLVVPYVTGGVADCPDGTPLPAGSTTYPQPATAPG